MTTPDLRQLVAATPPEDLPELGGRLREAELLVEVRLRTAPISGNGHGAEKEEVWLTPEEAGRIAGVDKERIYSWARGQRWATRPSRRCLRVSETDFRRWLGSRK